MVEFNEGVRYVVRVPVTGWVDRFTQSAEHSFISQALTMPLVRKQTAVPVPEVYGLDTSRSNLIGAPYIVMSFVDGYPVSSMWFDETGPTPVEERRSNTLDSQARAIPSLQRLQFTAIGSLEFGDGISGSSMRVGPCYRWNEGIFGDDHYGRNLQVDEFGPFESSKSDLSHHVQHYGDENAHPFSVGSRALLNMMISSLPLINRKSISPSRDLCPRAPRLRFPKCYGRRTRKSHRNPGLG